MVVIRCFDASFFAQRDREDQIPVARAPANARTGEHGSRVDADADGDIRLGRRSRFSTTAITPDSLGAFPHTHAWRPSLSGLLLLERRKFKRTFERPPIVNRFTVRHDHVFEWKFEHPPQRRKDALLVRRRTPHQQSPVASG